MNSVTFKESLPVEKSVDSNRPSITFESRCWCTAEALSRTPLHCPPKPPLQGCAPLLCEHVSDVSCASALQG